MHKTLFATLIALGLSACAPSAAGLAHQQLVGEIQIKGNEPFPTVMLETPAHDSWELLGVPIEKARPLVGRQVKVQGEVIRAPGPGVWLPSLRVEGNLIDAQ